jgi:hypothetical protein
VPSKSRFPGAFGLMNLSAEFDTRAADLPRPSGPAVRVADEDACRGDMTAIKRWYLEHNRAQRNLPIG